MLALGCGSALDTTRRVPAATVQGGQVPQNPLSALFTKGPAPKLVYRGDVIAMQGQPAETLFQIVSGTVRCCLITEDGHRQVVRFAGPGDVLGAAARKEWTFAAEAIDDVVLRSCPRDALEAGLRHDDGLRRALRSVLCEELERREELLVMVSHMHADDRLLAFLSGFADRARRSGGWTRLPMGRQDLADHLGLSFETVSRTFSALKRRGAIEMNGTDRYRILADDAAAA